MTEPVSKIKGSWEKLKKVRANLIKLYNAEFLNTLIKQALNEKSRYKPTYHDKISLGDVVLLKEDYHKPVNYPMGIVKKK